MALEYFAEADLRALAQMDNATLYTDERIDAVAAFVVARIEGFCRTAFVTRNATETHDGGSCLVLRQPFARTLTTVTVDGVSVTVGDLSLRSGVVRYEGGGTFATSLLDGVAVTYAYGYSTTPPADIKEAALAWTRYRLLATNSNVEHDARRTQVTNDMGGTTTYAIASKDRPSGYPEVDAVLVDWRDRLNVFGFA